MVWNLVLVMERGKTVCLRKVDLAPIMERIALVGRENFIRPGEEVIRGNNCIGLIVVSSTSSAVLVRNKQAFDSRLAIGFVIAKVDSKYSLSTTIAQAPVEHIAIYCETSTRHVCVY